ncbi:alanyl-tRNA editing protein AlaXM [Nanoarchaeota archaeon]
MEAIYLDDAYMKECDAEVISVTDGKYIVLDKTIFYPSSGGQPHDTGKLVKDGKEYPVVFTGKFSNNISHEVSEPGLEKGDKVHCVLDWERRYKLMRMHTAAHVVSAMFHDKAGAMITGNQKDVEKTRIDLSLEDFDREKIQKLIDEASKIMETGLLVEISYMPREKALGTPGFIKLANKLPPEVDPLRIVKIGDVDMQCDGGTHVKNTSEVGKLKVLKMQNKGKANRRVYFGLE